MICTGKQRVYIHLASEKYWPIDMHVWNGHNLFNCRFLDKLHIQVTVWA